MTAKFQELLNADPGPQTSVECFDYLAKNCEYQSWKIETDPVDFLQYQLLSIKMPVQKGTLTFDGKARAGDNDAREQLVVEAVKTLHRAKILHSLTLDPMMV